MTADLSAFILARVAEDEAEVQDWPTDGKWGAFDAERMWMDPHGHPIYAPRARVLAQCAALRAVVEAHPPGLSFDECAACFSGDFNRLGDPLHEDWPCPTLRALAGIWRDHEEWREDWA